METRLGGSPHIKREMSVRNGQIVRIAPWANPNTGINPNYWAVTEPAPFHIPE